MAKSLMFYGILLSFQLMVMGQAKPVNLPGDLIKSISVSKPDTNQVNMLLKLGSYYLFKPGEFKSDLDSALNFLNQAVQLSNKLHEVVLQHKALDLIGNCYAEAGNMDRCKESFMHIITDCRRVRNIGREANAWDRFAELYNNYQKSGHLEERIGYFQHARTLYFQCNDQLNATTMLKNIADVQIVNKQFGPAEIKLQQVLVQYKALGYRKLQYTYDLLYELEYLKGNSYRAMAYTSEAIKSMRTSGDTSLSGHLYFSMARCNYLVGKNMDALEWIHKAIATGDQMVLAYNHYLFQILIAMNRVKEAAKVLNSLSKTKALAGGYDRLISYRMFGLYYAKTARYDLAARYYLKVLRTDFENFVPESESKGFYLICNNELAGVYLKANQAAKAKPFINNAALAIKNSKTSLQPRNFVVYYNNLYMYNLATGNYKSAVKNLVLHNKIQDSLFTANNNKQISELNIQYETAQREQSIKILHSQSAFQQARLEKANLQRNITIGGLILLFMIAGFVYNGYLHKQKSNLTLHEKQKEINVQNAVLQNLVADKDKLLGEKDWLLKEVHHRVKNNLQIVMSLLSTQSAYLKNDAALAAIRESRNRVQAISLIHQRLYKASNVASIDMPVYINELIIYLQDCFDTAGRKIRFDQLVEPIQMDLSQAIPAGLILNEAITNAIKYAFTGRGGEIIIALQLLGSDTALLTIGDDGMGLPGDFEIKNVSSLGMEMMKALAKQLNGSFDIKTNPGVAITIEFKIEKTLHGMQTENHYA
ncbi:MAG: sensor histidine kinase [Bacteroidota bacterium]